MHPRNLAKIVIRSIFLPYMHHHSSTLSTYEASAPLQFALAPPLTASTLALYNPSGLAIVFSTTQNYSAAYHDAANNLTAERRLIVG
jgi:hypothetical protein